MITWSVVTRMRMKRQYLLTPVNIENYDQLFHDMSPVPTMYWTAPGNPPTLPGHVSFNDYDYNSKLRSERKILKARFGGGSIGYVTQEDLEVFACLYKKEVSGYSPEMEELLELLRQEGPMNIGLMKQLTGMLVKEITPALHKLQEAFLVYEDQLDNEGDRGWYLFDSEFSEVDFGHYTRIEALKKVLPRTTKLLVFFNEELLKSYYRLPLKLIKEALTELEAEGEIFPIEIEGRKGYLLREDQVLLEMTEAESLEPKVILLQRNDFLVRAYADQLKAAYSSEWDPLYYLLIDGEFHGMVVGRFKFGPHIIEDIVLDLLDKERRQKEIFDAVYQVFDCADSPIKRYCGKETDYDI